MVSTGRLCYLRNTLHSQTECTMDVFSLTCAAWNNLLEQQYSAGGVRYIIYLYHSHPRLRWTTSRFPFFVFPFFKLKNPSLSHFGHLLFKVVVEVVGNQVVADHNGTDFQAGVVLLKTYPGTECEFVSFLEGTRAFLGGCTSKYQLRYAWNDSWSQLWSPSAGREDSWWTKHSYATRAEALWYGAKRKKLVVGYYGNKSMRRRCSPSMVS